MVAFKYNDVNYHVTWCHPLKGDVFNRVIYLLSSIAIAWFELMGRIRALHSGYDVILKRSFLKGCSNRLSWARNGKHFWHGLTSEDSKVYETVFSKSIMRLVLRRKINLYPTFCRKDHSNPQSLPVQSTEWRWQREWKGFIGNSGIRLSGL